MELHVNRQQKLQTKWIDPMLIVSANSTRVRDGQLATKQS